MKINHNNKKFRPVENSENGETTEKTIFEYKLEGNIEMKYHQINTKEAFMTEICFSKLEILSKGNIRLHETWQ